MKKVVKFGGSSLASARQFKKVKAIIDADKARGYVVPSAPGKRDGKDTKVTDLLYQCYEACAAGQSYKRILDQIKKRFDDIINGLDLDLNLDFEFDTIEENFKNKHNIGRDEDEEKICMRMQNVNINLNAHTAYHIYQLFDELKEEYNLARKQIDSILGAEGLKKEGFVRVRIDGEVYELGQDDIQIDRKKKHEIELVVDRLVIKKDIISRLTESVEVALKHAENLVLIDVVGNKPILYSCNYACPDCGFSFPELTPRMFSFNNPFGACPSCTGIGYLMKMDEDLIIPDKSKTLYDGVKAFGASTMKKGDTMAKMYFESIAKHYDVEIKNKKIKDLPRWFMEKILYGTGEEEIDFEYKSYAGTRKFKAPFEGVIPTLDRRHSETKSQGMRDFYEMYMTNSHCPACNGARLKPEILAIKVGNKNINELTEMSIKQIKEYLDNLELSKTQKMISELILKEINQRLQFLIDVGLEYLTLSRGAGTLSGGEAQRIRLATQIGSGLTGVLYILDEPSIGLHQRDNDKLLATLKKLRDLGNTLLVVEHDEDTMYAADQIIDIGPGAGTHGGKVMAQRYCRGNKTSERIYYRTILK
mgnify:CR=1 FL=1